MFAPRSLEHFLQAVAGHPALLDDQHHAVHDAGQRTALGKRQHGGSVHDDVAIRVAVLHLPEQLAHPPGRQQFPGVRDIRPCGQKTQLPEPDAHDGLADVRAVDEAIGKPDSRLDLEQRVAGGTAQVRVHQQHGMVELLRKADGEVGRRDALAFTGCAARYQKRVLEPLLLGHADQILLELAEFLGRGGMHGVCRNEHGHLPKPFKGFHGRGVEPFAAMLFRLFWVHGFFPQFHGLLECLVQSAHAASYTPM